MEPDKTARPAQLVELLRLERHPEGGRYRQIYRSESTVKPADERSVRQSLTSIYFLLTAGEMSRWHRVRSDEVWHLYEGGPLELLVAPPDLSRVEHVRLDAASAHLRPVAVVAADWWQAARPLGDYALCGCTVAPGFEFEDFSFLRDVTDVAKLPLKYRELL
jgi:uncharacterized protein